MFFKKFTRGFTLIELLVVIAIIGILAGIIMASLTQTKARGRDAKRIADIKTIQLALELYYNDNLTFPTNIYAASGALIPTYMSVMPYDPSVTPACTDGTQDGCYRYVVWTLSTGNQNCNASSPPVKYHLAAMLEQTGNSALSQDVDLPVAGTTGSQSAGYLRCNTSAQSDFNGQSNTSAGTTACSNTMLSPYPNGSGVVENCYDTTN